MSSDIYTHVDYKYEDKDRREIKARPQDSADNICQTALLGLSFCPESSYQFVFLC